MEVFNDYLNSIENIEHRKKTQEVLSWVTNRFPNLTPKMAWNQPMFTDHGTFIIGFSVAKQHLAVAPEKLTLDKFSNEIIKAGYEHGKMLVRLPFTNEIPFQLLEKIIEFNIKDKASCTTFWRK